MSCAEGHSWCCTDGCLDYKTLSNMPNLSVADRKIVQKQLMALPSRTKAAQETEMGDMMGKLKSVSGYHMGVL